MIFFFPHLFFSLLFIMGRKQFRVSLLLMAFQVIFKKSKNLGFGKAGCSLRALWDAKGMSG